MSNTGKPSEDSFEKRIARLGKRAKLFRLVDPSDLYSQNGFRPIGVPPQPSDYILTLDGVTAYAEVKSTTAATSFRFAMLERTQWSAAVQVTAAGGLYLVFVHNLKHNRWFRIPASAISEWKDRGLASVRWTDLLPYEWVL